MTSFYERGFESGQRGVPAPAPGWGTTKQRRDYIEGWRAGRTTCRLADDECFGAVKDGLCFRHTEDSYSDWSADPSVTGQRTSDEWGVS